MFQVINNNGQKILMVKTLCGEIRVQTHDGKVLRMTEREFKKYLKQEKEVANG